MTHTTSYDSQGLLTGLAIKRGSATTNLRSMTFSFDGATGNLLSRTGMSSLRETFEYDDLDRLTRVKHGMSVAQEMGYSTNGNIVSKTGVGTLYYDGDQPHAVSAVNNTSGYIPSTTQQVTYTPFGKVATLTDGDYSMTFTYGPDQQRWKTVLKKNGTVKRKIIYADDYERVTENGTTRHFFYLDNGCIYVINDSLNTGHYYYAFTDHLGSVTRIYDSWGLSTVFEASYDAWGKQTVTKNTIHFQRGYTGHEMLPEFGLINMNGRLYDPVLGRFLSPDNYVQMPDFSQSFNRYSYCINNPLKYKDPSGEVWWIAAALIGGAINVAMNIDNIDNGWDFLGYFGVGAAAGALGGDVGNAVAGAIGVGGFVGGTISGLAGGLSSGFVLGGGNSLVTNGNFDGFLESALTGAVIGGVTGAIIGLDRKIHRCTQLGTRGIYEEWGW